MLILRMKCNNLFHHSQGCVNQIKDFKLANKYSGFADRINTLYLVSGVREAIRISAVLPNLQ